MGAVMHCQPTEADTVFPIDRDEFADWLGANPDLEVGKGTQDDPLLQFERDHMRHPVASIGMTTLAFRCGPTGQQQRVLPEWAREFCRRWVISEDPWTTATARDILAELEVCGRSLCGRLIDSCDDDCSTDGEGHYFCSDSCAWQYEEAQLESCAAMKAAPWD